MKQTQLRTSIRGYTYTWVGKGDGESFTFIQKDGQGYILCFLVYKGVGKERGEGKRRGKRGLEEELRA